MTKQEFKQLFLKLTEWTIPFGKEKLLEKYLPSGYKKDSVGNYYYQIGESDTLFTTHLDTYSEKFEKVNHRILPSDEYKIATDGKTILGGDNKLGCCILIGMIKDKVPGTYYFFLGEEPLLSGGLWGSSNALQASPDFFYSFKRCVAFDRKGYGSIVMRQMGRFTSSPEFNKAIADELKRLGNIEFDETTKYGYYTDTATFMDIIPECTNISAGGFGEHTVNEWVDLNYTYGVYQTAKQIKWDELPTRREFEEEERFYDDESQKIVKKFSVFTTKSLPERIQDFFSAYDQFLLTRYVTKNGVTRLTYSKWLEDFDLDIWVKQNRIYLDKDLKKPMNIRNLKRFLDSIR